MSHPVPTGPRSTHAYDLVIVDMDGTIFDPEWEAAGFHGGISPVVRAAITEVQAAGVPVTIATGRTFEFVRRHAATLGLRSAAVTTQGAVVGDLVTGHIIREELLPLAEARALAAWADETGRLAAFYFNDPDGRTHIRQNLPVDDNPIYDHVMGAPREIVGALSPLVAAEDTHRPVKLLMFSHVDNEADLPAWLEESFGGRITATRTHTVLVEVTAAGVDKGSGVLHLCEHLGIQPERVLAIGDHDNDIPMLRVVGMPVAMENGSEGVRAQARWIAPSIDDDGVAVALRKFILEPAGEQP